MRKAGGGFAAASAQLCAAMFGLGFLAPTQTRLKTIARLKININTKLGKFVRELGLEKQPPQRLDPPPLGIGDKFSTKTTVSQIPCQKEDTQLTPA